MIDVRPTIVPKSDQLNAEQLLSGPITLRVTSVVLSADPQQPLVVHYDGEDGRPYKPCLTMRKILAFGWGPDGEAWVGRLLRVYNDTAVRFGKDAVGGVRISEMSDIPGPISLALTETRGKKRQHIVQPLRGVSFAATDQESLKTEFAALWTAASKAEKPALKRAYDERMSELCRTE